MAGARVISIAERFRAVVASQPDEIAMTTPHTRYTYADIDRWSDAVAHDVIAMHAPLDRPIAIITADNIALVPAVLGVVKAGHFFVTIDATDPDERIAMLLHESNAMPLPHIAPFPTSDVPGPPERAPHPYVYVIYTSGTTGKPKGILSKQARFVESTLEQGKRWDRKRGERSIYTSLPGFVRAPNNIFGTLLCGATMCAFDARNESLTALADYIRRERITLLSLTPPLFRRLMSIPAHDVDLSSVRALRIGADVVTIADVETFKARFPRSCTLVRGYASSESGAVFHMTIDHDTPVPGPLVPMGVPYEGVEVWLLDDDGNEVADGETGELVVRGASVVDGYWNAPELTAERFVDGRFFTGDLVKRGVDGLYYFIGRKDSRLKIHGRRIDPHEIESALLATGDVAEAAVIGKPDTNGELRLVAYVVVRNGKPCDAVALRNALRAKLPNWMIPARIFAIDAIPMTRAAKADRAALLARVDEEPRTIQHSPSDSIEAQLLDLWSRVLGTAVAIDDDFFELGGQSVTAAHLVTTIENELGRSIPLSQIVELNTVRKMAAHCRTTTDEKPLAVMLQKGTTLPPLFCVAGAGGGVVRFRALAAALGEEQPVYGLHPHGFDLDQFPSSYAEIVASYASAIRRIQPHGPYYLSGYSSGGTMAFALARFFELAGESVAFVGVIDTARNTSTIAAWRRALNRITLLAADPRRARRLPYEIRVRTSQWMQAHLRPLPNWLHDTRRAMRHVRRDDSQGSYTGPVTLFRARDGLRRSRKEQDLGWTPFAIGGLTIIDVDGDHDSILGDHVQSLGAAMKTAL